MDLAIPLVLGAIAVIVVTAFAPRLGIAAPLILVVVGVAVSFLPFVSAVELEPELILGGVLPPLLYSSAVSMPTMDFRRDFKLIGGLSVILVVVTSVLIGWVLYLVVPDINFPMGVALGAIISPTDAVATSIVKRLGVSPRIVTILEGSRCSTTRPRSWCCGRRSPRWPAPSRSATSPGTSCTRWSSRSRWGSSSGA
ncbi:hypothetical protein GCM10025864_18320 [Luteimicrobium album]|uniref:Cation/H+ exchanger transmembrane domain-containing protein n=1 Tax=Luteimicrobium album TaxID=1054550 RepID=A0ABQ6I014_9MICO|nr:hypothetical protein GCM10025864_18320 [Luteimicrobium album]